MKIKLAAIILGAMLNQQAAYGEAVSSEAMAPETASPELMTPERVVSGKVIEVREGVWVAKDFGLANSILVETDNGSVIIDTMESLEAAGDVKKAFSGVIDFKKKPIQAIIYTHFHADHIFGAQAFSQDTSLPVYAHKTTPEHIKNLLNITQNAISIRSARQFGTLLDHETIGESGAGIGPELRLHHGEKIAFLEPNRFVDKELEVMIGGVRFVLLHTPGETDDQITVWLPDLKVVMPGDNIYHAFPNIYAIRGTRNRSVLQWVSSLKKVEELNAEYMVPSHTEPLSGNEYIKKTVRAYRDGMKAIHDQTVRLANQGLSREQIVHKVKLPETVKDHPYLKELYGTVKNSVRSVFSWYFGWFSGKSVDLDPLPRKEEAYRMIHVLGDGWVSVWQKAHQAMLQKDSQWALQLTEYLLLDTANAPDQNSLDQVKKIKIQALEDLAARQVSWANKNYYRTEALETRNPEANRPGREQEQQMEYIGYATLESLFNYMSVRVPPEKLKGKNQTVAFHFTDKKKWIVVNIRNGMVELEYNKIPGSPDLEVELTEAAWKELVSRKSGLVSLIARGSITFPGRIDAIAGTKFALFLSIFRA